MSNHSYLNVIDKLLGSVDSTTDVFFGKLQRWLLDKATSAVSYPTCGILPYSGNTNALTFVWEWCGFNEKIDFFNQNFTNDLPTIHGHTDYINYCESKELNYKNVYGVRYLKYKIIEEYSSREVSSESSGYITKLPTSSFRVDYINSWFNAEVGQNPSGPDGTRDPIQCFKEDGDYFIYVKAVGYMRRNVNVDPYVEWYLSKNKNDDSKVYNFITTNDQAGFYKYPDLINTTRKLYGKTEFEYPVTGRIPYVTENITSGIDFVTIPVGMITRIIIKNSITESEEKFVGNVITTNGSSDYTIACPIGKASGASGALNINPSNPLATGQKFTLLEGYSRGSSTNLVAVLVMRIE